MTGIIVGVLYMYTFKRRRKKKQNLFILHLKIDEKERKQAKEIKNKGNE